MEDIDNNKRIFTCHQCNKQFNWSVGCCWYGSDFDLENNPEKILKFCSVECATNHKEDENKENE